MTYATEQPVPDEAAEQTEAEPEPDPEPTPEDAGPVAYKVIGRQRVDEVKRGGTLYLDPDDPRTARLIARGQIARAEPTQED